ncbi:isopeptide-forming domain-containing fimbrial protein [Vineibacter terrae]|uniref:beta strand repeat-containing protein n=1 Tax=Vineibacter terrae TaxID=2586908 RepID=UPI002E30FA21|nr:isopeptide-forming domain-containing fimbrial protein [Vineibacter terrae]HEX2891099.1 isopeptide-forming domain-containing fimbrial protein [Vineibacter terrae]
MLLGDTAHITVTFDNVPDASPGSNTGYAPYIDLIVPTKGADGSGPGVTPPQTKDGVTFQGATYLGQPVEATSIEFDASGNAVHPFARDAAGQLRVVHAADYGAQPGDTLVVLRLPFGSFTPEQPAADVQVQLGVSQLADVGTPLTVSAVGGFAFGRDALDNPTTDNPVVGPTASGTVTPELFILTKTSNAPEGETATGPSFPRQYTVNLDVATGQTVTNLVLQDLLPNGVVVDSATAAGATVQILPAVNRVIATFDNPVVGVAGPDATLIINFHVGEFLTPGNPLTPVLDPATGGSRALENNVRASADWTPLDTRDEPGTFVIDPAGPENVIVAKALAIQKTATIVGGGSQAQPGDIVEWTLNIQVSDYFDLQALTLTDLLSDAQRFDPSFAPTISVQEQGVPTATGAFAAANFTAIRVGGPTTVTFRVGDELVTQGFDNILDGGGGVVPAPTVLTIRFHSIVEPTFADGTTVVDDDSVSNAVSAQAQIPSSGNSVVDGSSATVPIVPGEFGGKTIYAINGVAPTGPNPLVTNGDVVTFRIQYNMPITSADNFVLADFLPLPIFSALGITFQDRVDGTAPPAGVAWFGPTDTFDAANPAGYAGVPTVVTDATQNSVSFQFGSFSLGTPTPTHIDILFSVVVQDQPYGDGLLFNNLVQSSETNSDGEATINAGTSSVILSQPQLNLDKGIVASSNPDAVFSPSPVAPFTVTAPGSTGVRFSGTVSSDVLASGTIDSNVTRVDGGDLVTFMIVVENTGSGRNGAFDVLVRDAMPAGFIIPTGGAGLNLQVTDGTGAALAFTGDLFTTGITLVDGANTGALAPGDPSNGRNVLVITYDLRLANNVAVPNLTVSNLASIDHYAAEEGGTDFAPNLLPEDRQGSASTTTAGPSITKAVVATSLPQSSGSNLLIGEEVFYDVTLTLSEGTLANLTITDTLPNTAGGKIVLLDATLLSVGGNISYANSALTPGTAFVGVDSNGDGLIDQFTAAFGNTLNLADNIANANDQIVIRVHGVLPNIPENNAGDHLTNVAVATFTDGAGVAQSIQAGAEITVAVPGPTITKTVSPGTTVDAGDVVTYTVVVSNPITGGVAAPAFDMLVNDLLDDPGLSLVAGSVTASGTSAAVTILRGNGAGDSTVLVSLPVIQAGESLTIQYQAVVSNTAVAGDILRNTAQQRSDTVPGLDENERVFISGASAQVNVAVPSLTKTVTATDLADTGTAQGNAALTDLAFGETVTFTVQATMPEGVTQAVVLLDRLPVGTGVLEALSATITGVGANLTIGSGAGAGTQAVLTDRDGDGRLDTATFTLGNITNTPDGVVNANDQITFTVLARLISTPSATPGIVLTNVGQVGFTTPAGAASVTASASVEVVAPHLELTKVAGAQNVDGGDTYLYTVRVTNNAESFSAPAYDLVGSDLISDPNLTLVPGTVTLSGPASATITSGNSPGDTTVGVAIPRLGVGETLIITYRVVVGGTVPSGTELVNEVDGQADSFPGTVDGERIFTGSAGAVVQVKGPLSVKTIASTSLTETQSGEFVPSVVDLAIGEQVTYRISHVLAEGATTLTIVDMMPTAGVALELLGFRVATVGGNLTLPGAPTATFADTDGDGRSDRLTLDFGTILNRVDNVQDLNDVLTIEVDARVPNDARNAAGDTLVNTAQVFVNGSLFSTNTARAEIVEPDVLIAKQVSQPTGDAGDEVTFTVTIAPSQTMTGPAYDMVLNDLLAPGLVLVPGSVTASRGTIVLGNGATDTQVRVIAGTGVAMLPDTPAVTITYRARLTDSIENGQTIVNTASLTYDSAPSTSARPYAAAATSQVIGLLQPDLEKTVVLTDVPQTETSEGTDPAIEDVNQGETVVYRLTARLGEGTQSVQITEALPAGLRFIDIANIQLGSSITGDALVRGIAVTQIANALTFDFGTLVNHGDNVSNAGDDVTIDIVARVRGDTAAGTILTNDATLLVGSPTQTQVPPVERFASDTVEVVAPVPVISKTASIATGDAGDEIVYTVVLGQDASASGPLLRPFFSDFLGAGLVLVPGSVTTTRGIVTSGNGASDSFIAVNLGEAFLPDDGPVTVTYRARLVDAVEPGQVVANVGTFEGLTTTSLNLDTQVPVVRAQAAVTVDMPVTLQKSIIASSIPETQASQFDPTRPDVAVGEFITYRIAAALSEGTQHVVITDTLPDGVVPLTVRSSLPGFSPVITISGQTITADFGVIVNPGNNVAEAFNIGIDVDARVLDVTTNVAGAVLTNAGHVEIASPTAPTVPGGTRTADAAASLDVVEPELVLDKATNAGFIAPGEAVPWTLTLRHDATSTSAAFDITIQDLLAGTGLDLVAGSVIVSRGTVTSGNTPGDNAIGYALDVLPLGETVTITFLARTAASTPPGATVVNTATGAFDSAPGPGGRPDTVEASAELPVAPGLVKDVVATSIVQTGTAAFDPSRPDVNIGEEIVYRITATLPQATLNGFTISDLLPAGLVPLGASVVSIGSALSGTTVQPGDPGVIAGQNISFDFGTVVNAGGSPAIGAEDTIVVEVRARVADVGSNFAGATLVNPATMGFAIGGRAGTTNASAAVDVVEPALSVTKAVDHTTGDAGDAFVYTVTIAHTAGSTGPAFDLLLEDPLPAALQPVSVTSSVGTATLVGSTVRLTLPAFLPGDAPIVLTYVARFADTIEPGQQVPNVATLTFDSAPAVDGRPGSGQASATVTGVFGVLLSKDIVATSVPQTDTTQFDPARPDLAIGETVTWRLTSTLSEGTQHLVITDTLPDGVAPVSAQLVSIGAGITAAQPTITISGRVVIFDFGTVVNTGNNVAGDDTVVVDIQARVADVPGNAGGHVLNNDATTTISSPTAPTVPGGIVTAAAQSAAEVVTPALALDKTADKTFGSIGEAVTYTIVLRHAAGSTAPAFDVVLDDPLAPGMRLVAGSVVTSAGVVEVGNGAGDSTLRIVLTQLLLGDVVTIQYTAEVATVPLPQGEAINIATVSAVSAPGPIPAGFLRTVTASDDAVVQISSGSTPTPDILGGGLFPEFPPRPPGPPGGPPAFAPIFAGTGQPGAPVSLGVLDSSGGLVGFARTTADVGGNWLAVLPTPIGPQPPLGSTADRLADSALFSGRGHGPGTTVPEASDHGGGPSPMTLRPFDLLAGTADPTPLVSAHRLDPIRLTFDSVFTSGYSFETVPRVPAALGDITPAEAARSLAWNRFALDFVAAMSAGSRR